MNRTRTAIVSAATAVTMALGLGGCSHDEPSPEATRTTTTATPAPTVRPQPEGADGVTWHVDNWDDHADDPAVLAWKQLSEALSASVNRGRLVPAATSLASRKTLRPIIGNLRFAWSHDLHVRPMARTHVLRSERSGTWTRLVTCSWSTSVNYYKADGTYYGGPAKGRWLKDVWTVQPSHGRWIVTSMKRTGTCRLGSPS